MKKNFTGAGHLLLYGTLSALQAGAQLSLPGTASRISLPPLLSSPSVINVVNARGHANRIYVMFNLKALFPPR